MKKRTIIYILLLLSTALLAKESYVVYDRENPNNFNLKKWMNRFLLVFFMLKIALIVHVLTQIKRDKKEKYDDLYLMLFRLC